MCEQWVPLRPWVIGWGADGTTVKIEEWDYTKILRDSTLGDNMTDDQDLDNYIENLAHDDAKVRGKAAHQIYRILRKKDMRGEEIPDISETLTMALKDQEEGVRKSAARAMKFLEIDLVKEALKEAIHDDNWQVRSRAAESLGPLAIETLIETVWDEDEDKRNSSVHSLAKIGRRHGDIRVVDPLSRALSDETLAYSAASGLGDFLRYSEEETTKSDILEILILNSENGTGETIEACYYELGEIDCEYLPNSQRLHNHMIEGLSHVNDFVRRVCCGYFCTNHINEAEDKLIQILSEEQNRNVRYNAIQALGLMHSFNAVPKLLENLDDDFVFNHGHGLNEQEVTIQIASFKALARISSEDYLDQLIEVYENIENKEKTHLISALALYKNQKVMNLFRKEIEISDTEKHGSVAQQMIGASSSVMTEAIDALCSSNEIEYLSLIVDCASDHNDSEIRRHCIKKLISDEATDVFMQNTAPFYLDAGDNTSNHEIFKKFLVLITEYLSTTDCITQEDRMMYTLGGFGATLQGEVLMRLHNTYSRGVLSSSFPMNEIVELWKNADYS